LNGSKIIKSGEPLVSILMNCYNGEKHLHESIESILEQTYKNWEVVFWDNRSTDKSAEIFKEYGDPRLKYYLAPEHTDLGLGRAQAFQYLNGEFIAVLDTDDVWLPLKLEKQIPLFEKPEVGIVISDTKFFNKKREKILYGSRHPPTGQVFEKLLTNYFVSLETLVVRKSTVLKLSRAFDPEFSFIADFDFVLRLSRISELDFYPEVLAKWRIHENSYTWKSPFAFVEEKERWIVKQIEENHSFFDIYKKQIQIFKIKNCRERALVEIRINQNRVEAFKYVCKTRLVNWRDWILLLLCLTPFAAKLFLFFYKRKTQLY